MWAISKYDRPEQTDYDAGRVQPFHGSIAPEEHKPMAGRRREGNRPDRRIWDEAATTMEQREALCRKIRYVGSANHKLRPGDYGFIPSHNPRPSKSPCDALRSVLIKEASELFQNGIMRGMVSRFEPEGIPKYVWAVDADGEVYEAKAKADQETVYHGYRIGEDEQSVREYVLEEWKKR